MDIRVKEKIFHSQEFVSALHPQTLLCAKSSAEMGKNMSEKEMIKLSIEEFSRIQQYMMLADKESEIYKAIKERYIDLKAILTSSGVNLTEIDRIKA